MGERAKVSKSEVIIPGSQTRYVGSGTRRVGSETTAWDLGSQAMGSVSGCIIFVESETTIFNAFGIKNQKFEYKNWISD